MSNAVYAHTVVALSDFWTGFLIGVAIDLAFVMGVVVGVYRLNRRFGRKVTESSSMPALPATDPDDWFAVGGDEE